MEQEVMEQNRTKRGTENREAEMRPKRWMPPTLLPDPEPESGWAYRWVRVSTLNNSDPQNISLKLREGWEPVKTAEQPKLKYLSNPNSRFPDSIEIGGLLLCKAPAEFMKDRDSHYQNIADNQMSSVDNSFMRQSDARMPLFKERSTKVTFGKGI
jgi:hypothetical protein